MRFKRTSLIDLHSHSTFSDGALIPSELARRAEAKGYVALAITDHADHSTLDWIVPRMVRVCERICAAFSIRVLPGVELTHVHPAHIAELTCEARRMGARIVVVHGETLVEPVRPGTNLAAIEASVDILAHPGLISDDEAALAAKQGVFLEITSRKGHSLTNGHVLHMARKHGTGLVLDTDSHEPGDLLERGFAEKIARGAGMTEEEASRMFRNSLSLVEKAWKTP